MCRVRMVLLAALAACPAQAKDPTEVDPGVADRALEHLGDGSLHIEWDSNGEAPPRLLVVISSAVFEVQGDRTAQVHLERRPIAVARPHKGTWKWSVARAPGDVELGPVDLARLHVPSREVEGMFVNLARLLKQPCAPRWPAIDLPALDREQAQNRIGTALPAPPAGQVEVRGWLRLEGRALSLVSEEATWELAPPKDAVAALLRGREGAEVLLRLVPRGEARGQLRKATVERVVRVVTPAPPRDREEDDEEPRGSLAPIR